MAASQHGHVSPPILIILGLFAAVQNLRGQLRLPVIRARNPRASKALAFLQVMRLTPGGCRGARLLQASTMVSTF